MHGLNVILKSLQGSYLSAMFNLVLSSFLYNEDRELYFMCKNTVDNSVKIQFFDLGKAGNVGFYADYLSDDKQIFFQTFPEEKRILNESILVWIQQVLFDLVGRKTRECQLYVEIMK